MNAHGGRSQLRQIVDGLGEGAILIEPDQRIVDRPGAAEVDHERRAGFAGSALALGIEDVRH